MANLKLSAITASGASLASGDGIVGYQTATTSDRLFTAAQLGAGIGPAGLGAAISTSLAVGGATLGSTVIAAAGANNAYTATIAGGSVTGSGTNGVGLNITGTMNTSGVVDGAAIFANITNTASDPASLLTDFKLGGISRTTLTVDGKQTWFLYNGSTTGLGSISYATPGGLPGLILFTGSSFNSNRFDISYVSTSRFAMGFDGDSSNGSTFGAQSGNVFVLSSSAPIAWNSTVALTSGSVDTFLTRKTTANLQFGNADAAAPVAQTLGVQSVVAGTTNTSGQTATLIGSLATGSGISGDWVIKTGGSGAGATAQNTATTALTVKGVTQRVIAATTIATGGYTVATLPAGVIGDCAYVTDALTPTFLGILTGGSSTVTPVFYNGSAWIAN